MPIEIELPDKSIAEFPDGMSDEEIASVLKKQFPPQPPPRLPEDDRAILSEYLSTEIPKPQPPRDAQQLRQNPDVVGVAGANIPQPTGEEREILSSPMATAMTPMTILGRPINAALQDAMTTIAGDPESGGNLYELFTRPEPIYSGQPLPFNRTLSEISSTHPATATAGKIASAVVESAPSIPFFPQGIAGRLVEAGFTAYMIANAGDAATRLGEEMGKPPEERDYDKITTALSEIGQAGAFAPVTGAVAGRYKSPRMETIEALAKQLQSEPIQSTPKLATPERRLGLRVPEELVNPLAAPEIKPIVDQAFAEASGRTGFEQYQYGGEGIFVPEQLRAVEKLSREQNPPRIEPARGPRQQKEGVTGGKLPNPDVMSRKAIELLEDVESRKPKPPQEPPSPSGTPVEKPKPPTTPAPEAKTFPPPPPGRTMWPAVRSESGKIYIGIDHPEATSKATAAGDTWRSRGYVNKTGEFKSLTEIAREAMDAQMDAQPKPAPEAKTPPLRPGDRLIKIEQPDGTVIEAVANGKNWEVGGQQIPNVGRAVEIEPGKMLWSDGPLRPGERILESSLEKSKERGSDDLSNVASQQEQKSPQAVTENPTVSGEQSQAAPRVESVWRPEIKGWTARVNSYLSGDKKLSDVIELAKQSPENASWHARNAARIARIQDSPGFDLKRADRLEKLADKIDEKLRNVTGKAADSAISAIENLQAKLRKGPQSGQTLMGVPSAILDTALEAARLALKAGKPIAEAIEAAIRHIRYNVKGKWNEKEIRALIEREVSPRSAVPKKDQPTDGMGRRGVVGVSDQPVAIATGAGAKGSVAEPAARTAGLDDIYKIFEPAPKTPTPIKKRAVNVIESVRTGVSSKFRPINKLAEDIAKAYGLSKPKDIAGIMEQLKGSQGKGEAEIYRFDKDVSDLVKGNERDFNAYMFLRRAIDRLTQDAKDIEKAMAGKEVKTLNRRRVANYTLNELNPKLETLKQQLGPEKLAEFEKAADAYQRHMDNALALQVESGRMSKKVYDAIKNGNQFYAPFKVMKYLEESSRPEGSGKKIDTVADFTKAIQGIEDPNFKLGDMLAAARQSILMSRILADKNLAMRHVAELAPFDVDGIFIKKLKEGENPPQGMESVNVLEAGKKQAYAVAPEVANAIQLYGGTSGGVISRLLSAFSVPFRAGATAFNIPFQASNLMADVPRAAFVSKYGLRGASDLVRFPMDFVHSLYSSIMGDVFGSKNQLFLDFLDSGVAGSTVQEFLTPEMLKFKEPTSVSRSRKLASTVLNTIPNFAKAIEQTSKVMGVKRAMRFEGVTSGKELAKQIPEAVTEIRRFNGSPDFGRQGKFVESARLNLLYMFLNARIQGTIADVGRLVGRDGKLNAARMWLRLLPAVGIPTAALWYLNNSPENAEDYYSRSEQERQNYWLIPKVDEDGKPRYITTEDGETVRDYWRIPKRESSKWIANLTESALLFSSNRDPKSATDFGAQMLQEISPVNIQGETAQERLESVASSLNPVIKMPLELATGRDLYRHRPMMNERLQKASPEEQYTDRTPEPFKKLAQLMPDVAPEVLRSPIILENMTRNLTAGLVTQFMSRKPVKGRGPIENQPLMQRFQSIPILDNTDFQSELETLERQAADEQLNRHRKALKLIEENPNKSIEAIIELALPGKDSSNATGDDVKLARHLVDIWVGKQNGANARDRQLMALPARQRALWIQNQIGNLQGEEREQKLIELARKRIYTEAVARELAELMGQK